MRIKGNISNAEDQSEILGHKHAGVYFSQSGEDVVLAKYFRERRNGFYVDVGCHHSTKYSNTFLLHKLLGWSGVNIDADPEIIRHFSTARPNDINIHAAVSDEVCSVQLSIYEGKAYNTIDGSVRERYKRKNIEAVNVLELQTQRLGDLLSTRFPDGKSIDFLNVDVEGVDLQVLKSLDWDRFPVEVVCVEDPGFSRKEADLVPSDVRVFLMGLGFRLYAQIIQSSIYLKKPAAAKI